MDVKAQIEQLVSSITKDNGLKDKFLKDPVSVVKAKFGDKLPTDAIDAIVTGVKAKLSGDKLKDAVGGLGKLFGK